MGLIKLIVLIFRIACKNPPVGKPKYIMALNESQINLSGTLWLHLHCENVTGRRNADRILSTGKSWYLPLFI